MDRRRIAHGIRRLTVFATPLPPPERGNGDGFPSTAGSAHGGLHAARAAQNARRFQLRMLAAALAYIAATAALRFRESMPAVSPGLQWLLVGLAVLLAGAALSAYLQLLRQADELQRRIQLEALGLGFASGAVVALLYPLFELLGAPALGGRAIAVVLLLAWAAGAWLATRRFSGGR